MNISEAVLLRGVNEDYFLLDGQHRLRLAFRAGMKFIDVIMQKKKDSDERKRLKDTMEREQHFQKLFDSMLCN